MWYLRKLLKNGKVAFEIIYEKDDDGKQQKAVGYQEINPKSIRKTVNSKGETVWVMDSGITGKTVLSDSQIIYIDSKELI